MEWWWRLGGGGGGEGRRIFPGGYVDRVDDGGFDHHDFDRDCRGDVSAYRAAGQGGYAKERPERDAASDRPLHAGQRGGAAIVGGFDEFAIAVLAGDSYRPDDEF